MSDKQPEVGSNTVDNSRVNPPSQDAPNIIETVGAKKIQFKPTETLSFIDKIFHTLPAGHRLTYSAKTNEPSLPLESVDMLKKVLTRTSDPKALYFCASSCVAPQTGRLTHSVALFSAFHVVVLDDIGTKVPISDLPDELTKPSYIIESSKGNYQYGYILKEPITNYDAAKRLIQTLSLAGLTDSGGAMPCKIVRLPDGVNGKDDPKKYDYPVTLKEENDALFTPEEILTAVNYSIDGTTVTWEGIKNTTIDPMARKYNTSYLSKQPTAQHTNGVIDDVLEWLYENGKVISDSGDGWVEIECPTCAKHSDPSDISANYFPLGRGEGKSRGFKCFHDHCSETDTKWFLQWVINQSDFELLALYQSNHVSCGDHVYCRSDDNVYPMYSKKGFPLQSFKRGEKGGMSYAINYKGATVPIHHVDLWLKSPYLIVVDGEPRDVSKPDRILIDHEHGHYLNTYEAIPWGEGAYDQAEVDYILNYIRFLLPNHDEYKYFMDWVAAKVQNPAFRGTAIVMMTPTQGIGRSTLFSMLSVLLGEDNHAKVRFDRLSGAGDFNEWSDKLLVSLDEASQSGDPRENQRAYNRLKEEVDTNNAKVTVNVKYKPTFKTQNCTSFLIATNHTNGLALDSYDRRFTIMTNPDVPLAKSFYVPFTTDYLLRKDPDGLPTWARHFYRYLKTLTPDLVALSRPLHTQAKQEAIQVSMSHTERAAAAVEKYLIDNDICFVSVSTINTVMTQAIARGDGVEVKTKALTFACNRFSSSFAKSKKINGAVERIRIFTKPVAARYDDDGINVVRESRVKNWSDIPKGVVEEVLADVKRLDATALLNFITEEMV